MAEAWEPEIDWKTVERHALSAEYEDMEGQEWKDMCDNLQSVGIINGRKIIIFEGKVLDGWQLLRVCREFEIEPQFEDKPAGISPDKYVEIVNDCRRKKESAKTVAKRAEQRRLRVAAMHANGHSTRAIADAEKVSQTTVQNDLATTSVEQGVQLESEEVKQVTETSNGKVTGTDGKTYSASKPPKQLCVGCERRQRKGQELPKACPDCKLLRGPAKKAEATPKATKDDAASEDESIEDNIKRVNGQIESFCRGLMKYVEDNLPDDPWLRDQDRLEMARNKFKNGCDTLRSAKCFAACPLCNSDGCDDCRGTGRVTKMKYEMVVTK